MPIIRPSGLLAGERIAQLSDTAKLYWPFLYAASNGYGRFELDYQKILDSSFRQFKQKPTQEQIRELIREYRDKNLLFLYRSHGRLWCAWDDASHQQYFNSKDKASPAPPEPAFSVWRNQYRANKSHRLEELTDLEREFDSEVEECSTGFNIESISSQYEVGNESIMGQNELSTESIESQIELDSKSISSLQRVVSGSVNGSYPIDNESMPNLHNTNTINTDSLTQTHKHNTTRARGKIPATPESTPDDLPTEEETREFSEWAEHRYAKHPKKREKFQSLRALQRFCRDPVARELFERNHDLYCETSEWTESGGRFAPKLREFIEDDGWKYPPIQPSKAQAHAPGRSGTMQDLMD